MQVLSVDRPSIVAGVERGSVARRFGRFWDLLRDRAPPPAIRVKARREQTLRRVRILRPCLVIVLSGRKTLVCENGPEEFGEGDLIALPQGAEVDLRNAPGRSGTYRAICIAFDQDVIRAVGQRLTADGTRRPLAEIDHCQHAVDPHPAILAALEHALDGAAMQAPLAPTLIEIRLTELYLALLLHGRCPRFLVPALGSLAERTRVLVSLDPRRDWRLEAVARELAVGTSTLRRRLGHEGTSFRGILEEVRLNLGLMLVQAGRSPILEIAHACGYESPSKFAARFRARFGVSPSELRDGA